MTVLAPAAIALATSPGWRMPPSAIRGTPVARATSAQSRMAVSWGTPTPATRRVVQAKPGPMPTLTASAPASARSRKPSAVATLPATTSLSGQVDFSSRTASMVWSAWPWATSTTRASTSASSSAWARAR